MDLTVWGLILEIILMMGRADCLIYSYIISPLTYEMVRSIFTNKENPCVAIVSTDFVVTNNGNRQTSDFHKNPEYYLESCGQFSLLHRCFSLLFFFFLLNR